MFLYYKYRDRVLLASLLSYERNLIKSILISEWGFNNIQAVLY